MDEKNLLLPTTATSSPAPSPRRRLPLPLLVLPLLALLAIRHLSSDSFPAPTFNPRGTLPWSPCPDVSETLCGYLAVPMDYSNPLAYETVSLALRMLPATAPLSEQLGSLFINPGGPGGSGTSLVLRAGTALSVVLRGRYNILSWDPRAVNLTSPSLKCFPTAGDGVRFARDIEKQGLLSDSDGDAKAEKKWVNQLDVFGEALDGACEKSGEKMLLRSSSTAFVARDMKRILEAIGEEKLSYWGFSYGTILGATFSAMFPDLVHRVLLDGISDSVSYTNNFWDWGRSGMTDTAKTYAGFFDACASSVPAGCALATNTTKDVAGASKGIQSRVEELAKRLRARPVAVVKSKVGPGSVGASDVKYAIFHGLYAPKFWPALATALASLEKGDGTLLYEMNNPNGEMERKDPLDNVFHRSMESSMASTAAIMCSDTDHRALNDTSISTLTSYVHELDSKSPTGEIWAMWVSQCRRWRHRAIESYRGPWTIKDGLRKTNFPILFLSNTADPVTPLSAARSMSKGFGNESASLLIQNGFGHCSLAHPSLCTIKAARAYFLEGVVPKYGTTCDSDEGFLFPVPGAEVKVLSAEDEELQKALHELAEEVRRFAMKVPTL